MTVSSRPGGAAGFSKRMVAVSLMLGMFVSGLDTSIVNIILPTLQSAFGVQADRTMMLGTIYLTMLAGLQLLFGRCADLFDAAAVFACGLILFLFGSLGCALSSSFGHILWSRAVQGSGGAMMAASFGALILADFPRDKIGGMLGAVVMSTGCGTIVGPPLGGFLAEHLSWRWAFLLNVPLCLAAATILVLHLRAKPRSRLSLRERLGSLDMRGGLLSIVMFTSLPIGIGSLAEGGWASLKTGLPFGLFVLGLVLFVVVERRAEHPLLRLSLFRNRHLDLLILIKVTLLMLLNGLLVVFPFFLIGSIGLSSAETGVLMLANAVSMAVVTPLCGRVTDRWGGNGVMAWGGALLLAVAVGSLLLPARPSSVLLAALLVLFGAAMAAVLIASTTLLLKSAPEGLEGVFSGMNSLAMSVGGSLGLALFSYLYAVGALGRHGAQAARGGFSAALFGVVVGAAFLLALIGVHAKSSAPRDGSTIGTGGE